MYIYFWGANKSLDNIMRLYIYRTLTLAFYRARSRRGCTNILLDHPQNGIARVCVSG